MMVDADRLPKALIDTALDSPRSGTGLSLRIDLDEPFFGYLLIM
jgi:hypothetical protein